MNIERISSAPRDGTPILIWMYRTASHHHGGLWRKARWGQRPFPHPVSWVRNEGWCITEKNSVIYADKDVMCWTPFEAGMMSPPPPQIDGGPTEPEEKRPDGRPASAPD